MMNGLNLHISEYLYRVVGLILFCFYAVVSYVISTSVTFHSTFMYFDPRFVNTFFALCVIFVSLYPIKRIRNADYTLLYLLISLFVAIGIVSIVVPTSHRLLVGFSILSMFVIVERIVSFGTNAKNKTSVLFLTIVALIPAFAPVFLIPNAVQTLIQLGILSSLYNYKFRNFK